LTRRFANDVIVGVAHFHIVATDGTEVVDHQFQARVGKNDLPRFVTVELDALRQVEAIQTHARQKDGIQVVKGTVEFLQKVEKDATDDTRRHTHLRPVVRESNFQDLWCLAH
jgi:hypothetical protein